jgi:hypothetical protein
MEGVHMYYKHSGRFNLGGLLVAASVGCAGSLVLAYVYAWGIPLIPEVHLAGLATLAFGGLAGVSIGYGQIWGKVRNGPVGIALAAAIATLALYVSWAAWVPFVLESQHVEHISWIKLAQHPAALWNLVQLINQDGTWSTSSSGTPTSGLELWGIWVLEGLTVIGVAIFAEIGVLNHRPFCESCERWCTRGAKVLLAAPPNVAQLKLQLEANDFKALENLGAGNKATSHLIVVLDHCEQCRQFYSMSLTHVLIGRTKLGKPTVSNKMIVQHLLIDAGKAEMLRQLSEKVVQAAKIAAPQSSGAAAGKK